MLNPVASEPKLAREIFYAPGSDGVRITFGVLGDGRCAVARAGAPVEAWDADAPGILAATRYFWRLTGVQASANPQPRPAAAARRHVAPPSSPPARRG